MKRIWLVVALVVVALLATGCDWGTDGYSAAHTGFNPGETRISTSNVASLAPTWEAVTTPSTPGGAAPVVAAGRTYFPSGHLYVYDGVTGCEGTPNPCGPIWQTSVAVSSSASVVAGVVYSGSQRDGRLYAFDAAGVTGCAGSPRVCQPLWSAVVPGASGPTVTGGTVYVSSSDQHLYAFDAAGVASCSGTPKVCQPRWTASASGSYEPVVDNGRVFTVTVTTTDTLVAFDAAGSEGCSGTPKVCSPLWSSSALGGAIDMSVAADTVYVGSVGGLFAFDASGTANCTGSPRVCSPRWSSSFYAHSRPTVANGRVYVDNGWVLTVFDAAGVEGCGGVPRVCAPLWQALIGLHGDAGAPPAVANGVVWTTSENRIYAFDAGGTINCHGTPTSCGAIWSQTLTSPGYVNGPVVANGSVYATTAFGRLVVFSTPGP